MKPNDPVPSISALTILVVAKGYMEHELAIRHRKVVSECFPLGTLDFEVSNARWLKFLKRY